MCSTLCKGRVRVIVKKSSRNVCRPWDAVHYSISRHVGSKDRCERPDSARRSQRSHKQARFMFDSSTRRGMTWSSRCNVLSWLTHTADSSRSSTCARSFLGQVVGARSSNIGRPQHLNSGTRHPASTFANMRSHFWGAIIAGRSNHRSSQLLSAAMSTRGSIVQHRLAGTQVGFLSDIRGTRRVSSRQPAPCSNLP